MSMMASMRKRSALPPYEDRLRAAIAHYWQTLDQQAARQSGRDADRGRRSAVTGGKQMDGFCNLVNYIVTENGLPEASIFVRDRREIPGYFRPTKEWDLIVIHERHLVVAIEFKSQRGPSFGNNFNNRTEEALGNPWRSFSLKRLVATLAPPWR
jgi:Restriction endonuclease XhoI